MTIESSTVGNDDYLASPIMTTTTSASGPSSNLPTLRYPTKNTNEPDPTNYDYIQLRITDADIEYHLDADDIANVFGRFTIVHKVTIDPETPSRAIVSVAPGTAAEIVQALNGRRLHGIEGILSAVQVPGPVDELIEMLFANSSAACAGPIEDEIGMVGPAAAEVQLSSSSSSSPPAAAADYFNLLLDLYRKSSLEPSPTCGSSKNLWSNRDDIFPSGLETAGSYHSPFRTPASQRRNVPSSPWTDSPYMSSSQRSSAPRWDPRTTDTISSKELIPDQDISKPKVRKWTARYEIQIEPDDQFQVTRRIIGSRGANMKKINQTTGAKLRLRGRGSGYLEGSSRQEADDPLHLCISSCDASKYRLARQMTEKLLRQIYTDYDQWVVERGGTAPGYQVRCRELYLPTRVGSRDNVDLDWLEVSGTATEKAISRGGASSTDNPPPSRSAFMLRP